MSTESGYRLGCHLSARAARDADQHQITVNWRLSKKAMLVLMNKTLFFFSYLYVTQNN